MYVYHVFQYPTQPKSKSSAGVCLCATLEIDGKTLEHFFGGADIYPYL